MTCLLKASNSIFSDPCVGTYKYLDISYSCVPPNSKEPEHPITTSLHYNCNMLIVTQMMNVVFKMLTRVNIHCPFFQSPAKYVIASMANWTVVCIPSHCFLQDFLYMLHLQNVLQSLAVRIFTTGLYKSSSRLHSNVSAFVRTLLETAEVQFWPVS